MSDVLTIHPAKLRHFGESEGSVFCVVTDPRYVDRIVVEPDAGYRDHVVVPFDGKTPFSALLANGTVPQESHVVTITLHALLESPTDDELGRRRKLSIMACNSAPTPWDSVAPFVEAAERIDPAEQVEVAERFFALGEASKSWSFVDAEYGCTADFEHLREDYNWFEQLGPLDWGGQQVLPSGEISCFLVPLYTDRLDPRHSLSLNGTIAIRGLPVLHSGPPSFLLSDQQRIHDALATSREHAVLADVTNGVVTSLRPTHASCEPAARMLQRMFDVDSRFRYVFEIGFSLNTRVSPIWANIAMNEVYGGQHGHVHFGLGMLPFTQYHLDLICTGTHVVTDAGAVVLGAPGGILEPRAAPVAAAERVPARPRA